MNTKYVETKTKIRHIEHTIISIYGKNIKEADYPDFEFVEFRPAKENETFINLYNYTTEGYIGPTVTPRIIVKRKEKRKRYIFEEDKEGKYSLEISHSGSKYYYYEFANTKLKKFNCREEEF